jgi:hypothetical protein
MALPIGSTPVLSGKEATKFMARVHKDSTVPARPTPTPKLARARELIKAYAGDGHKQVRR